MKFGVTTESGESRILTIRVISQGSTAFRLGKPLERHDYKFIMFMA